MRYVVVHAQTYPDSAPIARPTTMRLTVYLQRKYHCNQLGGSIASYVSMCVRARVDIAECGHRVQHVHRHMVMVFPNKQTTFFFFYKTNLNNHGATLHMVCACSHTPAHSCR